VALDNSDGFWTRASDYSISQDEKRVFHVIPHDVNEGLGVEEGGGGRRGFGPPPGPGGEPGAFPGRPGEGREPGRPGGGRGMAAAGPELDPLVGLNDDGKALRSKLLAVPALRAKYMSYVREIAERWLDWRTLGPMAQRYHDLIAPDVTADTRKIYTTEEFEAGLNGSLKTFVERRRAFLLKPAPAAGALP
jgi:hypothetical protein